jgi:glycosyltransferase involved in cell wall biosynthesis
MRFQAKAAYAGPFDGAGVPLLDYRGDIGSQHNPIAIAQYGLARFNRWCNTPDAGAAPSIRAKHGIDSRFVVLYIGAHGISHALSSILEVASRFRDEADVCFVFVGDGAEKQGLVRRAGERSLSNVRFFPSQPRETVPAWYASADVVLVPLRDIPVFDTFIPSKMFEILACERPIIASVRREACRILERSGGAVVVNPDDVDGIAQAIRTLRADAGLRERLGRSGGAFARTEYDRRVLAGRYLGLLEATCHPG